jgi:hypothetical protein
LVILPLLTLLGLHGPNYLKHADNDRPNVFPPSETAITKYLSGDIGLATGRVFNGRVATITSPTSAGGATWDDAFRNDIELIQSLGNEHRTIGMWFYGIPTLIEFNHLIRPLLFAVTKTYLAHDEDGQSLNILNFRDANIKILRLLGVRYLVTDRPTPTVGARRILSIPAKKNSILALDEISDPNIGVSPTQTIVRTGRQALDALSASEFDFETTAIVSNEGNVPLSRAVDVHISVEQGGLRVQASSGGTSMVVIPFQFSHCFRLSSRGPGNDPTLLRADFLLTAILFRGNLDALLEYRQGPFAGMLCGLKDFFEDRRALSLSSP